MTLGAGHIQPMPCETQLCLTISSQCDVPLLRLNVTSRLGLLEALLRKGLVALSLESLRLVALGNAATR